MTVNETISNSIRRLFREIKKTFEKFLEIETEKKCEARKTSIGQISNHRFIYLWQTNKRKLYFEEEKTANEREKNRQSC